jgi:epoxyqueuosine reductase
MSSDESLTARVKALGHELGFARVGVARAERLVEDGARLQAWIDAGYHGTMAYMARNADVRADPTHDGMLPSARSVIVLAAAYAGADSPQAEAHGRIARYAQGRDYHKVLRRRLAALVRLLRDAGYSTRLTIDRLPVLERAWAQRAGVGFIGKNCCLIVPGIGSHVFLATVITAAELEPDAPMRERCGECEACLTHCPTRAFVAPRVMDARRCISYLTIEHRGAIDPALREPIGGWVFGCDVCQDVCPFNRAKADGQAPMAAFEPSGALHALPTEALLQLDEAAFAGLSQGSPMRRATREGLARNAAIALGNRGTRRVLPVLQRAAEHDASETVREAAAWALPHVERRSS